MQIEGEQNTVSTAMKFMGSLLQKKHGGLLSLNKLFSKNPFQERKLE